MALLLFFSFVLPSIEGLYLTRYGFSTTGLFVVLILTCSVPNLIIFYTPNDSSRTKRPPGAAMQNDDGTQEGNSVSRREEPALTSRRRRFP